MNSINLSDPKGIWNGKGPCDNYLNQQNEPLKPNSVWVSDFTYIKVNVYSFYLCVIIDLFSRKVVGWSISEHHNVELIIDAFEMACINRGKPAALTFHSNQSSAYTAFRFRLILSDYNVNQSFFEKGRSCDNKWCKYFFSYIKQECFKQESFKNQEDLRRCLSEYIDRYNAKRPHPALDNRSPDEVEALYMERQS